MRALTTNQQLITELERSRGQVLRAIDGLTNEQLSIPGIEGWSVRDHLLHLTIWDEMRFFEISRIARGGRAGFPNDFSETDVDWLNDRTVEMRRRLSLPQILADLAYARDMVLQAVAICPDERIDDSLYEGIGLGGAAEHDRAHAETIRSWRKKERM